ncbi:MAG TPA: OmpA family protein [Flavisolibacter sp.]|jgi:outer membrane protein OmpA-like peptidoglycan-associated protein|nr:OmpA family protein [Flavisolibacter sp.]
MYKKIIGLFIIAAPFISTAQLIANNGSTVNTAIATTAVASTSSPDSDTALKSFSKFDFVPGEKVIYAEDFAGDAVGELPLNWNTTGKGEVVTLSKFPGKWLRLFQNTTYLTGSKASFDKNFTVEFDLVLQFNYKSYTFPLIYFGLMSSNNLSTTDNSLLNNLARFQSAQMLLRPYTNNRSHTEFITYVDRQAFFKGTDQQLTDFESRYNKVSHVAMQVQGGRLRIWINSQKVVDAPKGISPAYTLNQLYFKIGNSGYKEDAIGFYVSNFKVATGLPDTRRKLIDEGKFSTTGILFDVNAATIKPESAGVLKEIAEVLKSNAGLKVKITGHTDGDGADASNMELSRKRAEAVKAALVKEYGVEDSRMATAGKGETAPVGDNKTQEGKAQNRRVEFIKI